MMSYFHKNVNWKKFQFDSMSWTKMNQNSLDIQAAAQASFTASNVGGSLATSNEQQVRSGLVGSCKIRAGGVGSGQVLAGQAQCNQIVLSKIIRICAQNRQMNQLEPLCFELLHFLLLD